MIDVQGITRTGLVTAWSLASQLVKVCSYVQPRAAATPYTPATGKVNLTQYRFAVTPMIMGYAAKEIDGERIRLGDEKILVKATELSALTPSLDDFIIETATAVRRDVIAWVKDATGSLWTFQCRRMVKAPAVPPAPSTLARTGSTADFTWVATSEDITGYRLQHRVNTPAGAWVDDLYDYNAAGGTVTGTVSGTGYDVRVLAYNGLGDSAASATLSNLVLS